MHLWGLGSADGLTSGVLFIIVPFPPSLPLFFLTLLFFNLIFIYLFMAALGLRCCARAFSSCREQGLLFVVARGLLIALASLVVEHGL